MGKNPGICEASGKSMSEESRLMGGAILRYVSQSTMIFFSGRG